MVWGQDVRKLVKDVRQSGRIMKLLHQVF